MNELEKSNIFIDRSVLINEIWYLESMPEDFVAELPTGDLVTFPIIPFRLVTKEDFHYYDGPHPRKSKGKTLPSYLYKFFGLDKNTHVLSQVISIKTTSEEKEKIERIAEEEGRTVSDLVREWIRSL